LRLPVPRTGKWSSSAFALASWPLCILTDPAYRLQRPQLGSGDLHGRLRGFVSSSSFLSSSAVLTLFPLSRSTDSNAPTWTNGLDGQVNLYDAIRRKITFKNPNGKEYKLNDKVATLIVRCVRLLLFFSSPLVLTLERRTALVDGTSTRPMSSSTVSPCPARSSTLVSTSSTTPRSFSLAASVLTSSASRHSPFLFLPQLTFFPPPSPPSTFSSLPLSPPHSLPKMEHHLEARLWNDVFRLSQDYLGVPRGSIRATVLIETITAAFQMDEIIYELREHSSGLNCGRWDCESSSFRSPSFLFPKRKILMVDFDVSPHRYLLVHQEDAHAPRLCPPRPFERDHDRPLHGFLRLPPHQNLPHARCRRDRRYGRSNSHQK
jgi:malate synthase